jgi:hypothetical protein
VEAGVPPPGDGSAPGDHGRSQPAPGSFLLSSPVPAVAFEMREIAWLMTEVDLPVELVNHKLKCCDAQMEYPGFIANVLQVSIFLLRKLIDGNV